MLTDVVIEASNQDYVGEGWIGVDLDGTLAHYDHWRGSFHIGKPIMPMVNQVKFWLENGKNVKIFTARVCKGNFEDEEQFIDVVNNIQTWCWTHIGTILDVTCEKDFGMIELWDDRAVQVEKNTGRRIG